MVVIEKLNLVDDQIADGHSRPMLSGVAFICGLTEDHLTGALTLTEYPWISLALMTRCEIASSKNLLYGAGIHMCPGAALARLELRAIMEELLAKTTSIHRVEPVAIKAMYPAGGFSQFMVQLGR